MSYKKERNKILVDIKDIILKRSGNSLIAYDCAEVIFDYVKKNINVIWDVVKNGKI